MNHKIDRTKEYEGELSVVDEGWWDSVLAEEQQFDFDQGQKKDHRQKRLSEEHIPSDQAEAIDWKKIKEYFEKDLVCMVTVVGHNTGGLLVNGSNISGFVPHSHLINTSYDDLENDREKLLIGYDGKSIRVKIIEYDPEKERVILSERAAQFSAGKRTEIFGYLTKGMCVTGCVTNITEFGVFIDIGGVEGLVHVSEMSWGRVSSLKEYAQLGQEIEVQVLDVFPERNRVALSRKRLLPNPWDEINQSFASGNLLVATITKIVSFGVFAQLDSGVEGLIHASEMNLETGQTPKDLFSLEQQVSVRILHLDAKHQRIGFTLKTEGE